MTANYALLRDLLLSFEGRDADGAPAADGAYWLGHSLALRVWEALGCPDNDEQDRWRNG